MVRSVVKCRRVPVVYHNAVLSGERFFAIGWLDVARGLRFDPQGFLLGGGLGNPARMATIRTTWRLSLFCLRPPSYSLSSLYASPIRF